MRASSSSLIASGLSPSTARAFGWMYTAGMVVTINEAYMPLKLTAPGITDEEFQELCEEYEDFRVEYSAEGDLLVMPPTDPETSAKNLQIASQSIPVS